MTDRLVGDPDLAAGRHAQLAGEVGRQVQHQQVEAALHCAVLPQDGQHPLWRPGRVSRQSTPREHTNSADTADGQSNPARIAAGVNVKGKKRSVYLM